MSLDTQTAPNALSFSELLELKLAEFEPGQREHFLFVLQALLDCYQSETKQGLLLLRDGAMKEDPMTLIGIHASQLETGELIDTLCQLRGIGGSSDPQQAN